LFFDAAEQFLAEPISPLKYPVIIPKVILADYYYNTALMRGNLRDVELWFPVERFWPPVSQLWSPVP
jgi:hypothetical protein